jgi:hypothetical protein
MVLRKTAEYEDFFVKVDERWIRIDEKLLRWHPGGSAMLAYKNLVICFS